MAVLRALRYVVALARSRPPKSIIGARGGCHLAVAAATPRTYNGAVAGPATWTVFPDAAM